jgi:hypothetical protein
MQLSAADVEEAELSEDDDEVLLLVEDNPLPAPEVPLPKLLRSAVPQV